MLPLISIVTPVFNEEAMLPLFYERLAKVLAALESCFRFEIIFTNNASTDGTWATLNALHRQDPRIQVLTFSRNFGYQPSLLAGIRQARGEAVFLIDVDCEDPPELLPRFLVLWSEGHDLVFGIRNRRREMLPLQWARKLFYRLTHWIADYEFIIDMGDFALFSRRVREVVISNRSTFPFIRTELGFSGFRSVGVPYQRERRVHGRSHFNPWRMTQFAWGGMLSSTTFFLRLGVYLGFPLGLLNLVAVFAWREGAGWVLPLVFADLSYLIVGLAMVATYLARIYKDGVQRPLYVIDEKRSLLTGVDFDSVARPGNLEIQPPHLFS